MLRMSKLVPPVATRLWMWIYGFEGHALWSPFNLWEGSHKISGNTHKSNVDFARKKLIFFRTGGFRAKRKWNWLLRTKLWASCWDFSFWNCGSIPEDFCPFNPWSPVVGNKNILDCQWMVLLLTLISRDRRPNFPRWPEGDFKSTGDPMFLRGPFHLMSLQD